MRGEEPLLDKERIERATDRLFTDLSRLGLDQVEFIRNGGIDVPGIGRVEAPILARRAAGELMIGVHGPLTPDHAADELLREVKEYSPDVPVVLVDEIIIARSLPYASQHIVDALQ